MASWRSGSSFVGRLARHVGRKIYRFGVAEPGKDVGGSETYGRIEIPEKKFFQNERRFVEASQRGYQVIVTDGNGGTRLVLGTSPNNPFPESDFPAVDDAASPADHARIEGGTSSWLD